MRSGNINRRFDISASAIDGAIAKIFGKKNFVWKFNVILCKNFDEQKYVYIKKYEGHLSKTYASQMNFPTIAKFKKKYYF